MKLISWNVNGIRACVQKGFLEFFREADADIFCLQETKLQAVVLTDQDGNETTCSNNSSSIPKILDAFA